MQKSARPLISDCERRALNTVTRFRAGVTKILQDNEIKIFSFCFLLQEQLSSCIVFVVAFTLKRMDSETHFENGSGNDQMAFLVNIAALKMLINLTVTNSTRRYFIEMTCKQDVSSDGNFCLQRLFRYYGASPQQVT